MSRIGKEPILIPENVTVEKQGRVLNVSGPKGELTVAIPPRVSVSIDGGRVTFTAAAASKAYWGLLRALTANAVKGVTEGFSSALELSGVGYKSEVSGDILKLSVGFSHPVEYKIPSGLEVSVEGGTKITISGVDKQRVSQAAADIKSIKPPEPYKGKGIKYAGEVVRRKPGKAAKVAAK